MSDEEQSSGFRVNDRRRFDSSGNERDGERPLSSKANQSAKPAQAEPQILGAASEPARADSDEAEINFSSFVVSLATQVLMQLGEMQPPPGVELPQDVAGAKQTIDILGMLQQKTKGNLDADEQRLLTEILNNLRLSFVRRSTGVK